MENSQAQLKLEDNSTFDGRPFGFPKAVAGELAFNTGMVGYPESLTGPSYRGQILVLTYPLIGNYGVPDGRELPALSGIDTRALTKRLREKGSILANISMDGQDIEFPDPNREDLVSLVSIPKPAVYPAGKKSHGDL